MYREEYTTVSSRNVAIKGRFTHSMPFPCRTHAVPLPCRAAKSLECVFPIWFTQRGRVWFTLAMPCPFHALTMPFFSRPQHSTAVSRHVHGMASVNQTRPRCVNHMGKTHSKYLAARHVRGTACYLWIGLKGDEDFRHGQNGGSRLLQNVGICPYYLSWSYSCVLLLGAFAELTKIGC